MKNIMILIKFNLDLIITYWYWIFVIIGLIYCWAQSKIKELSAFFSQQYSYLDSKILSYFWTVYIDSWNHEQHIPKIVPHLRQLVAQNRWEIEVELYTIFQECT